MLDPVPAVSAEEFIALKRDQLRGRLFKAMDIGRRGHFYWRCEAVTLREQSNFPYKVFVVTRQRLERIEGDRLRPGGAQLDDVEYRLGYYTIARNGKWWWGQYAMMIPAEDLGPLLRQAREEGTLLA